MTISGSDATPLLWHNGSDDENIRIDNPTEWDG
jgi:hypothetical protein